MRSEAGQVKLAFSHHFTRIYIIILHWCSYPWEKNQKQKLTFRNLSNVGMHTCQPSWNGWDSPRRIALVPLVSRKDTCPGILCFGSLVSLIFTVITIVITKYSTNVKKERCGFESCWGKCLNLRKKFSFFFFSVYHLPPQQALALVSSGASCWARRETSASGSNNYNVFTLAKLVGVVTKLVGVVTKLVGVVMCPSSQFWKVGSYGDCWMKVVAYKVFKQGRHIELPHHFTQPTLCK